MMKTRIKTIEYGDGKSTYQVQTLRIYNDTLLSIFNLQNPLAYICIIILLIPIIIEYIYLSLFWKNGGVHRSIENAKSDIDNIYEYINTRKEKNEINKKSKKVVSKTYIKYP